MVKGCTKWTIGAHSEPEWGTGFYIVSTFTVTIFFVKIIGDTVLILFVSDWSHHLNHLKTINWCNLSNWGMCESPFDRFGTRLEWTDFRKNALERNLLMQFGWTNHGWKAEGPGHNLIKKRKKFDEVHRSVFSPEVEVCRKNRVWPTLIVKLITLK